MAEAVPPYKVTLTRPALTHKFAPAFAFPNHTAKGIMHWERRRKCSDEHRLDSLIMVVSLLLCLSDAHAKSADNPRRERGTPANAIERLTLAAGVSASVTHRLGYRDVPDNIYSSLVWTSGMERTLRFHLNGAIDMRSLRSINIIPSIGLALLLPLEAAANGNADASTTGQRDDANRLPKKLAAGVLGGVGGGLLGAAVMLHIGGGSFGWEIPALLGFWGGNLVGTPVGVSAVDPQDNFLVAFAGSAMAGIGVPAAVLHLTAIDSDGSATLFFLSAFLGPIVVATTASELSRNPLSPALRLESGSRQILLALFPDHNGGLSAIASLRY